MGSAKLPDWLPSGWIVEVRVRKDGRKDKYYIHLNNRYKARSKNEVISYQKMGMSRDLTRQKIKSNINLCSGDKNMPLAIQIDDSLECLPKGWTVEIRTRKCGSQIGMQYKCYIDPLTGYKFYSMKAVSHYLKTGKRNNYTSQLRNRGIELHSTENALQTKEIAEGLPAGWIKEIKVKMNGDRTRRDSYYIDPATGYVFRSKREVLRYLDTGEVGRRVIKPKTRGIKHMESIDEEISLPAAAKRQKLGGSTRRRRCVIGKSSRSNKTVKDEQILEPSVIQEKNSNLLLALDQYQNGGECSNLSVLSRPESESSKKRKREDKVCAKKQLVSTPPTAGVGIKKHGNRKSQLVSNNYPRRTSKRLAGLKAEPTPDLVSSDHTSLLVKEAEAGPSLGTWACKASEPEIESKPLASIDTKEPSESEKPVNDGGHIEEGAKKTVEKPKELIGSDEKDDEKPGSPIKFSFGDSWPDPCLEFAYKTLTGVIPVENNKLGIDMDMDSFFPIPLIASKVQPPQVQEGSK